MRPRSLRSRSTSMICSARSFSFERSSSASRRSSSSRTSPSPRSGNRPCCKLALVKLNQQLRRCRYELKVGTAQKTHIRRWIDQSQPFIQLFGRCCNRFALPYGQVNLKDVALLDISLNAPNGLHIRFLRERRSNAGERLDIYLQLIILHQDADASLEAQPLSPWLFFIKPG